MDDKEREYVTKSYLEAEINELKQDIKRVEGSFERLELMFGLMKDTFDNLTKSISRMTDAQERTNGQLINMTVKQTEIELRQKNVEEDVEKAQKQIEDLGASKQTYISDVFKLVGIFTGGILTLVGTIITAVFTLFN
ncbi:hypothetical protein [Macrococcus capreoli]|uniref:hypothetical protein n=1 Tax=Macrococcus capreoli TaxID=2982690 RepID=UPI0021D5BB16|nr:hypothetical protein [Macrococcus sp. TMW 2.2395]MCU7556523.1 hypothetical protein [Macrococcus sp. TMW 2.2395]